MIDPDFAQYTRDINIVVALPNSLVAPLNFSNDISNAIDAFGGLCVDGSAVQLHGRVVTHEVVAADQELGASHERFLRLLHSRCIELFRNIHVEPFRRLLQVHTHGVRHEKCQIGIF